MPNPVVIGSFHPAVLALAGIAMWAEIAVELTMLRRLRGSERNLTAPLLLLNLTTWSAFLLALDACGKVVRDGASFVGAIAALEGAVVLVEAALLHALMHDRLLVRGLALRTITLPQALRVSCVGNLVSIVVSLLLPAAMLFAVA